MKEKTSISQKLQKFGSVLAGMVIPNIGAFIGFGLITAFFLETGWTPNAKLAKLISPILNYLLPILIGHTGGKMFGGDRGGVIGALVTMGAIVAVDGTPMFLAAMILGPVAGVCIKKFDQAVDGKIPSGFEMIVNNFSLGIIGAILCCFAMLVFGPVMETVTTVLTNGVNWIVAHNALPLSAIFVEPAKVLFLNNALDHGIFGPIGYEQVKTLGHSALFLLVPNPGAGLGLLLAYWFFGKGEMKEAAPGMILIHFFGGIHEVYFPYVLANPLTIIGMIAGGIVGTGTLTFLNVGTVATPSPGSIFSVVALSPKNCMFGVLLSVVLSCVVSFLLNTIFVKRMVAKGGDTSLGESVVPKEAMGSSASSNESTAITNDSSLGVAGVDIKNIKKIVVACDAGMGSSAMGVTILKKKLEEIGLKPEIKHVAVADIPKDADVVVTNVNLEERAKMSLEGTNIPILTLSNFMDQTEYERIIVEIQRVLGHDVPDVFCKDNIVLNAKYANKEEAIKACADIFIKGGYTDESYKADMLQRDKEASVYLGNGVALPHGLASSKETIKNSGICFVQVPDGVDFNGEKAYLLVGVAGKGEEHVELLGKIGQTLMDEGVIEKLKNSTSKEEVINLLNL